MWAIIFQILFAIPSLITDAIKLWQLWQQIKGLKDPVKRGVFQSRLLPLIKRAIADRKVDCVLREQISRVRDEVAKCTP